MPVLKRVGHKGAGLIVPGNTTASFDEALRHGVDMIEFDVLPEQDSDRLVLAHDWIDAAEREAHTLEEGLDHLVSEAFTGIELDVDLKLPGYELRVVAALRARGLVERTLVSSQYRESLAIIRRAEPRLRLGWSVPKVRRDPFRNPVLIPAALAVIGIARAVLPGRAATAVAAGECDVLMAHWRLVTPRLVRSVVAAGGEIYVWTVDELPLMRSLQSLGVTGVISNDPRLFSSLA
jgi:glycerophosphoryl diester phosphodiesterase